MLEGLFEQTSKEKAVIITHPHPQYGGDMYNSVVSAIHSAYTQQQFATLRFNFRGVGNSEGRFDNGAGEQKDVYGAYNFLTEQGFNTIELAGYSFGAWVNVQAASQSNLFDNLVLVSPPVDFMDFQNVKAIPILSLVIVGDQDEFAAVDNIQKTIPLWNDVAGIEIIDGADHFYWGATDKLIRIISAHIGTD